MSRKKVAVVTGGSSGIGLATSFALFKSGCKVYELSRRKEGKSPDIVHISCDVTDIPQVQAAISQVMNSEGKIDILVNNAGFGISGAIEFTEPEAARKQIEVNFFGMDNVCHAVLPIMRKQKKGRIVNISSVAAPIAIPFQAYYSASKAAISDYSLALMNEVRPYGISVVTLLPGDIHTGFTAAREKSPAGDDEYGGRISRSVAVMEHDEETGMDAQDAGDLVAKYALKRHPAPVYTIGTSYKVFVFLQRFLSNRLLYYIVGKLYAK